jgi:hypothetical protein
MRVRRFVLTGFVICTALSVSLGVVVGGRASTGHPEATRRTMEFALTVAYGLWTFGLYALLLTLSWLARWVWQKKKSSAEARA